MSEMSWIWIGNAVVAYIGIGFIGVSTIEEYMDFKESGPERWVFVAVWPILIVVPFIRLVWLGLLGLHSTLEKQALKTKCKE